MTTWTLVDEVTGQPVRIGDVCVTFRGTPVTVVALEPPHRPGTSGRVVVSFHEDITPTTARYYCTVIGCRFVAAKELV